MNKGRQLSGFVRRLLNGVSLPIAVVDPRTAKVNFANPAFEDLCGRTGSQLAGKVISSLFTPDCSSKIQAVFEILAKSKRSHVEEHECELIRRSGRRAPVTVTASRVRLLTKEWIILSLQDLTHIRRLQAQREANIKEVGQIAKLADIGMLAAGVAHELNNPLMIVQGYAENIDMLLDQPVPPVTELKGQTAEILRAADRMSRIISQMTRMVRSTDIQFQIVDLQEITQNVLRFLNHEIKYSNTEVEVEFLPQNMVKCDHNQVEQVIMNILNNALHSLEHRPEGRKLRISATRQGPWQELQIWNNGPAIPKEIQDKIMTPFFTTKEVGKGTGLGLTVSFGIMKAHGGGLSFKSDETFGTEFRLRFPAPKIEPVDIRPQPHAAVLLVDDDPHALEVLANKVRQFGFQVLRARNGVEAFRILATHPTVTAVFTDLRMPDMDGIALCRHIRQLHNPGPLVYAVTGYAVTTALEKELRAAGLAGVITKPINHNAFSVIMHEISAGKKASA